MQQQSQVECFDEFYGYSYNSVIRLVFFDIQFLDAMKWSITAVEKTFLSALSLEKRLVVLYIENAVKAQFVSSEFLLVNHFQIT